MLFEMIVRILKILYNYLPYLINIINIIMKKLKNGIALINISNK